MDTGTRSSRFYKLQVVQLVPQSEPNVILNFSMAKIVRQPYETGPFLTLWSLGELNRLGWLVHFVLCFPFLLFSLFLKFAVLLAVRTLKSQLQGSLLQIHFGL